MKNRVFALIMTICMIFSITSVSALAGDPNESKDICTCSSLCTEENIDYECPVCADDFTKCAYEVKNKENVTDASVDKGGTQETPECVCEKLCSEENINKDCEACLSDYSLCKGIDDENNNTENITDDKEEESGRIHEEGCILDADHEGDCVTNDTVMLFSYVRDSKEIYVSFSGNDDENDGTTKQRPYKTLAKAVDEAKDGDTIVVMDDITVEGINGTARVTDKHIVITSIDPENPVTITRGDNLTISDDNQSWHNSAIIEVTTNENEDNENASSVTLENIILTDNGEHDGTYFAQTNTEIDGNDAGNLAFVQDGMVTAHGKSNRQVYIILGEGAVLKDFGGMSAVYATGGANIVMKYGSKITAENVTDRQKSSSKAPKEETGPAGAIWMQGSTLVMEEGSLIENIIGRAVYIDGGTAKIDGNISGITGDGDMWQGKSGVAIHVRNSASATLNGNVSNILGSGSSAVFVVGGEFYMNESSAIKDCGDGVKGISEYGNIESYVYMNGEITGIKNDNAININVESSTVPDVEPLRCVIGPEGNIHDNSVRNGAIYMQTVNGTLDIYGKINNNINSGETSGSGVYMAHNHKLSTVTMYKDAEICNNKGSKYGGLIVSEGTFIMEGGTISGNSAVNYGGVYVRNSGSFIMNGGEIKDNISTNNDGGLSFEAVFYKSQEPNLQLNKGVISGNTAGGKNVDIAVISSSFSKIDRYMCISNDMVIGNDSVYIQKYDVMVKNPSNNIKFGNASDDAVNVLNNASKANRWGQALVSLWCQNDENATELIMSIPAGTNPDLPIYAAVVETDETGNALS